MCRHQVDKGYTMLDCDMSTWMNWELHFLEFHFLYELELAKRGTCAKGLKGWSQHFLRVIVVRCGDEQIQRCLAGPSCLFPLAFKHVFPIFKNLSLNLMDPSTLPCLLSCWLCPFSPFSSILCYWPITSFPLKLLSLFFSLYSFFPWISITIICW